MRFAIVANTGGVFEVATFCVLVSVTEMSACATLFSDTGSGVLLVTCD